MICISSRFFENQPDEICSHLSEKASKGRFLDCREAPKITVRRKRNGEKERARRKKGGKEKKSNGYTLRICNSYFGGKKKLLDAKGPFGDYLFKKSGQIYIAVFYLYMLHSNKAIQCQIMATKRRDLDTGGNLSTRRSWYHGRQPEVFLQHDSHCAFRDVLGLQSRTSKREFSG